MSEIEQYAPLARFDHIRLHLSIETIDQLDLESREQVRRDNLEFIREKGVTSVEVNVIYAVAKKV